MGDVYNFVWKSFFITIQIVPWSVAAIPWKIYAFFKWIDSIGKCNILQKIYVDLEVPVSIQSTACFCLGFLYVQIQDYFKYLLHAPLGGYVIYINEKWTEWRWNTHTYIYIIKWKISLNFWIKYKHYISLFVISAWTSFSSRKDSLANSNWVLHVKDCMP